MSKKVLVIEKNGSSEVFDLNKEKIILGRDTTCDVCLDDPAISRKHAVVIIRFDQIYIENISSSGQILRGDDPVEYVQMDEEAEFNMGPYTVFWKLQKEGDVEVPPEQAQSQEESSNVNDSASEQVPQVSEEQNIFSQNASSEVPQLDSSNDAESPLAMSGGEVQLLNVQGSDDEEQEDFEANDNSSAPVDTAANTRVTGVAAKAILKVMKGEEIGRQIKLDYGFQWVVGRSPRSHVQINNGKISRQHFKIYKVGNTYRVQDLGSSHGTKLNGVTVSDAPLQTFDTIQAGPVEIQYLQVDAKLSDSALPDVGQQVPNAGNGLGLVNSTAGMDLGTSNGAPEKTQFSPPVPYSATPHQQQAPNQRPNLNFNFSGIDAGARAPVDSELNKGKGPVSKMLVWYKEQPKPRQVLLLLVFILGLAGLAFLAGPQDATPEVKVAAVAPDRAPAAKAATPETPASTGMTQNSDVSPEFDLLPEDQKLRIRDLYAKAERAKMAKDWQKAFDHATEIHKAVKRYKKTTDILLEAQSNLTDSNIGSLAPNLKDLSAAQKEVGEQVKDLCADGEKALTEARWEDAMEVYRRAITLDPKSSCAEKGYAAAFAKDSKLLIADLPKIPEAPKVAPDDEAIQRARDDMEGLKQQYLSAKDRINQGRASESLPELYDLRDKLKDRLDGYSYGVRAPASIRDELIGESRALMSRVEEGISAMKAKLKADYQVQLADAEQFVANKQYAQAREIYDRILESDPNFDEVLDLREKLYTKIITEARNKYQEGLIYESVGDVDNAIEGYEKAKELLTNVNMFAATEYYSKANIRLGRLKR